MSKTRSALPPERAGEPCAASDRRPEPSFDPARFQAVPVPPELRKQLAASKLPRLDARFLADTDPVGLAADGRRTHAWFWLGAAAVVLCIGFSIWVFR